MEAHKRRAFAKAAAEIHAKLLEKFTTSQELVDFLRTDEGRRFLENTAGPQANPLERTLRSIRYGVILTIIGVGWLLLGLTNRFDDDGALTVIGFFFESVGLGFLASAGISHYFSRKWGLYNGTDSHKTDLFAAKPNETA